MMRKVLVLLVPVAALAAGAVFYLLNSMPSASSTKPSTSPAAAERAAPKPTEDLTVRPAPVRRPAPAPVQIKKPVQAQTTKPVQVQAPKARPAPKAQAQKNPASAQKAWWNKHLQQFGRLQAALNGETDPARRRSLIQQLGAYVRVDTLRSLDWAMDLVDPEERRAALESINRHALVGIGARIGVDNTGYPVIRETTVMSAVAATGQVEPGDYIVGMEDETGRVVSFKGYPVREIVKRLRGEAGSEVRLLMERSPAAGTDANPYEVTVQRSLLVIQPP